MNQKLIAKRQRAKGSNTAWDFFQASFDPLTLCDFLTAISATYLEIGAAASIHPNAIPVAPPCATENAGRAAALANQANLSLSERAFSAIMPLLVAGLAIEGL